MKRIAVTGAGGQIAYSLLFRIANGDLLGPDHPLALHLLEIPEALKTLEGVKMELEDCAFPLLNEIIIGKDPYAVFQDVDLAFLVGAKPRGLGMQRSDLLSDNGKIFVEQGKALNTAASSDVKVLVVGNPCNTNCLIALNHAPNLSKKNFHAMTRLDQNRATFQLAKKAGVATNQVTNVSIWGNHSTTQVPDFLNAKISGKALLDVIEDRDWLENDFFSIVQKRGAEIIASRGKSSAASAASAAIDAMKALLVPTSEGQWFSSAVSSDNNPYDLPSGLIFSFPCRSKGDGDYEIVEGLNLTDFLKKKIAKTTQELQEEKECVSYFLKG